jgi:hypothetical protein
MDFSDQIGERIENEAFLPAQWTDRHGDHNISPEQSLMLAVLRDALECFQKVQPEDHNRRPHNCNLKVCQRHIEAEDWIAGEGNPVLSFVDVCDSLRVNPRWIQDRLARHEIILLPKRGHVRGGQRQDRKITQDQG